MLAGRVHAGSGAQQASLVADTLNAVNWLLNEGPGGGSRVEMGVEGRSLAVTASRVRHVHRQCQRCIPSCPPCKNPRQSSISACPGRVCTKQHRRQGHWAVAMARGQSMIWAGAV